MKTSLKQNFTTNENMNDALFYNSLIEELESIIENELSKSYEEINAEVIDDCCLALDSIYAIQNGENVEFKNITDINNIVKKYNLQSRKKYIVSAACAAAAVVVIGMSTANMGSEILAEGSIFKTALGKIETFIKNEEPIKSVTTETTQPDLTETTTQFETTSQNAVSDEKTIKSIYALIAPGSDVIYNNVADIDLKNTYVGVNYTNGENEIINISNCVVTIGEPKLDGETKVTITYKGAETCIYVTVLPEEKLNPKTLTSIYGVFEGGYNLQKMRVFAVFSDGTEKEIKKSDCKITTEEFVDGDVTEILVTVEYENCSFQFINDGKGVE